MDVTIAQSASDAPPHQSIANYLVKAVPTARPNESAGDVCGRLAGCRFDDASHLFLVADDGRLVGVAAMGAGPTTPLAELASAIDSVSSPPPRTAKRRRVWRFTPGFPFSAYATPRFIGAVPASALISILRDEHLEDLHHMAGILGKSELRRRL